MSVSGRLLILAAAIALSSACQAGEDSPEWDNYTFRCADSGSGFIGLELVDIAGTPTISGNGASVFSNELVQLAGAYDLEGDAVSGGAVTISGSNLPGGRVIENGTRIERPDTGDAVDAAMLDNDNDQIPCIQQGNQCRSPLSGDSLSLNSHQQITLETGTYYFDSISINGQAQLNIDGDVVIYLDGPATFNGGSATNPDEDSLTLISAATDEIKLNGSSEASMHIVAPEATVRFAGTQGFRGTALANILRVNGTADLEATGHLALVGETCQPPTTGPGGGREQRGDHVDED